MNTFDNIIYNTLRESIVTLSKDNFDPLVFNFSETGIPRLRDSIKVQILKDIDEIRNVVPVVKFVIIGSILTKHYENNSDIDVNVQIDPISIDSISTADVMYLLKRLNGKMAADSIHPINYYIITHDLDESKIEAMYDVINDKWIKMPKEYDPEIEKWTLRFNDTLKSIDIATGQIRRDLIDLKEIKELKTSNIKKLRILMKQKLSEIETLLKDLINLRKDAHIFRKIAFDKYMTPHELSMISSRNHLPENILYKLLEKYYYMKFIKSIEEILDERNELSLSDIPKVNRIMGDLWKHS